ncbi:hypothetical protein Ahy_A04g020439 isoform H [Arachis hypogaea]|uniref:Ubiquitin-like protease family profile domain-containing protein n=1 Tax=Arachis hypogaea TaxID=3818 RepID=A0A445DHL8_ARAHY|nr:hypothetical protein Ahy_A04g020439 isoform H [Arachis hypogaea]
MEGLTNDNGNSMLKIALDGDDPTYAPTLDVNFSMDLMPFRSTRSKRGPRTRRSAPNLVVRIAGLIGDGASHSGTPPHFKSTIIFLTRMTFKLAFLPTRSMDLAGVELTVAAYIFSKDLPNSEILAYVEHCIADRTALLTLAPNERVMDDVITVVATMLSKTSNSYQWFMPTMIMQDALQGTHLTHANLDAVICNHMRCKVNKVTEIFQPMWTDGYWYLMVVDVRRKKLIYYDSLKCTRETEHRKFAMTQVALHLESLTVGTNWLSSCTAERPRFSSYEYEEPVAVNDQIRIQIAIDLVLRSHNPSAIDILEKAMRY